MKVADIYCLPTKAKIMRDLNINSYLNPVNRGGITANKSDVTCKQNLDNKQQPLPQLCFTNAWDSTYQNQIKIIFSPTKHLPIYILKQN